MENSYTLGWKRQSMSKNWSEEASLDCCDMYMYNRHYRLVVDPVICYLVAAPLGEKVCFLNKKYSLLYIVRKLETRIFLRHTSGKYFIFRNIEYFPLLVKYCLPGEGRGGWAPPRTCRGGARARAAWWSGCCSCSPPSPPATHTNIFTDIYRFCWNILQLQYFVCIRSKKNVSCKNFDRLIFHGKGKWKKACSYYWWTKNFHNTSSYFICSDKEQISWWRRHHDIMWNSLTIPHREKEFLGHFLCQ